MDNLRQGTVALQAGEIFLGDRGVFTETRQIYLESFSVKLKDGSVNWADAIYVSTASVHVWQTGSAKFPDNRKCHIETIDARFIRDILLTDDAGRQTNKGRSEIAIPRAPKHTDGNQDCNRCLNANHHLSQLQSHLGNYQSFKLDIDQDLIRVRQILELIGTVTP